MNVMLTVGACLTLLALPGPVVAQDDDATYALMHKLDADRQLYQKESLAAQARYSSCNQVCDTRNLQCRANSPQQAQCAADLTDCHQTCTATYTADSAAADAKYNRDFNIRH